MDVTIIPTSQVIELHNAEHFAKQFQYGCQLFRFYSSIILVIVGKKLSFLIDLI